MEKEILKKLDFIEKESKEIRLLINKKSGEITDRVHDFKSACEELNIKTHGDAYRLLNMSNILLKDIPIEQCDDFGLMIMVFVYAINEGHIFNWSDIKENKYFPRFKMSHMGFGFFVSYCDFWTEFSSVSSRLAYKTSALALYGGRTITKLYEKYMKQN